MPNLRRRGPWAKDSKTWTITPNRLGRLGSNSVVSKYGLNMADMAWLLAVVGLAFSGNWVVVCSPAA